MEERNFPSALQLVPGYEHNSDNSQPGLAISP